MFYPGIIFYKFKTLRFLPHFLFLFVCKRSKQRSLPTLSPLITTITNLSRTKRPTISSSCSILPCYSRDYPTTWRVLRNLHSCVGSSSRKLHQLDLRSNPCTIAHCLGLYCPKRPSRFLETTSNACHSMLGGLEIGTELGSWTCTPVACCH
jgi:hypothetical protein